MKCYKLIHTSTEPNSYCAEPGHMRSLCVPFPFIIFLGTYLVQYFANDDVAKKFPNLKVSKL